MNLFGSPKVLGMWNGSWDGGDGYLLDTLAVAAGEWDWLGSVKSMGDFTTPYIGERILTFSFGQPLVDLHTANYPPYVANPINDLSIISNGFDNDDRSADVKIRRRRASGTTIETIDPGLQWPEGMYSLSHIALPFPASDPLYGAGNNGESQTLGNLTLRGERGAIRIPSSDMLRQRWNPFYPYFKTRVHEFCHLENPSKALKNLEATSP